MLHSCTAGISRLQEEQEIARRTPCSLKPSLPGSCYEPRSANPGEFQPQPLPTVRSQSWTVVLSMQEAILSPPWPANALLLLWRVHMSLHQEKQQDNDMSTLLLGIKCWQFITKFFSSQQISVWRSPRFTMNWNLFKNVWYVHPQTYTFKNNLYVAIFRGFS